MGDRHSTILETFRVAIFDTIPEPLLVLDHHLFVLTANEGFFEQFKVSREETIGKCVFDLGNGQWNIHELKKLLIKMLPEKSPIKGFQVTHDFPVIGKRTMLVNANEIHSSEFIPLDLILVVFEDVTDKKNWSDFIIELNKNLEISNAELKTFGHSLTHDLRAPVGIIEGFTKMILNDYGFELSDEVKGYMSRVLNSAETMDQMISGLSQLSGLSRLFVNRSTVNLSVIAENVISQLRVSEPGRAVDVSIEQELFERVEPSMFLIALTNLLKNSWKFTRKQSIV
jgi:signal transduction histidine kinase